MVVAARTVILTAERILPTEEFARLPELTRVPFFVVTGVVHAPRGAWPTGCYPDYDVDDEAMGRYQEAARNGLDLASHLAEVVP
jgi:glutaconate CoA-transferase subunit A